MLKTLHLLPVYDSAEHDLVRELQVPLLQNATDYLRGVGFFTSGWLRLASHGMATFVENGGKARIVLSPIMEMSDWESLQIGEAAKNDFELKAVLEKRVIALQASLEKDTLNAMAWMIADGVLEMRFALPRTVASMGNYHDKVGVFRDDEGSAVAIHGSLNDSIQGSLNGEAFSVFVSWVNGQLPYLQKHIDRLEALWDGRNPQFRVCLLPDAIRDQIVQLRTTEKRPYSLPADGNSTMASLPGLHCPITLHPYQDAAISSWKSADCRGLFEMATGTGKTFTALAAAVDRHVELGKVALVVLVPYLHLLEQWERNCRDFGFTPVLCSSKHGKWQIDVKSRIQDFKLGVTSNICILAVHMTAASKRFQDAIAGLKPDTLLLVGDEAHGLGSKELRNGLTPRAEMRLGLSATPRRWYDDEGTQAIIEYFGKTCFEFPLEKAIGPYLTPYRYFPQLISLTDEEAEEFEDLTVRISVLAKTQQDNPDTADKIKHLLIKRARIIGGAEQKLPKLLELIQEVVDTNQRNNQETRDILVYCAPGKHLDVLHAVSRMGLRCHEFVCTVSLAERETLLDQFAKGEIQVLVAIKCLDEGVDIPSTRIAFVLASSTNPREFVQRRGRVLRRASGKTEAIVHDFIVVPPAERIGIKRDADISILKREMPRFAEFASAACNEFQARNKIREILNQYELLNLLDEKPWDVYRTLKQWDWCIDEQD